jgi:hypothetical protein
MEPPGRKRKRIPDPQHAAFDPAGQNPAFIEFVDILHGETQRQHVGRDGSGSTGPAPQAASARDTSDSPGERAAIMSPWRALIGMMAVAAMSIC